VEGLLEAGEINAPNGKFTAKFPVSSFQFRTFKFQVSSFKKKEVINLTSQKKIMILEDDEAIAELMSFYLQEEGFKTAISSRGAGFADKVAEYQPDLITIDILLPDTDGFRVFQTIQQDERISHIPVIFVSVLEKEKEKGIMMGARGYIVKPFKENELKETVKSILEKEP